MFGRDRDVSKFVRSLLPLQVPEDGFGPFTSIGIAREGKLIAGAIYHRWRPFDCELTFAASDPAWCKKGILRGLFHYPFEQCNVKRMTLIIGENNPRALKLNLGLGFKIEGKARKAYDGMHDAYVLGMLKEECKWLKEPRGN